MYNLDFGKNFNGAKLTFARIDVNEKSSDNNNLFEHLDISLNEWRGRNDLPFVAFR